MAATGTASRQSRYRLAQEREFYRYVPYDHSASPYAPFDHASHDAFVARPSRDSALTCFAQLAAIRTNTQRALISLFDRTQQHVLAEGTPSLSLVGGRAEHTGEQLRLGCCVLPKERGFCHHVEDLSVFDTTEEGAVAGDGILVVDDVNRLEGFRPSNLITSLSDVRFYAAAPLVSPRGFTIGALCVMDSEARESGLNPHTVHFMKEMADTIMNHLSMRDSSHKSRRAERMIVGLGSFVEGRSTLRDSWWEANAQNTASMQSGETEEGQLNMQQQQVQEDNRVKDKEISLPFRDLELALEKTRISTTSSQRESSTEPRETPANQKGNAVRSVLAGESLHDNTLAKNIQHVFSRAANLLRESIGVEGVIFLDANSQRFGSLVDQQSHQVYEPASKESTSSSEDSADLKHTFTHNPGPEHDYVPETTPVSECLGFSSSRVSSINEKSNQAKTSDSVAVPQQLFTSILRRYPHGKIFVYNASGSVSEDSESSHWSSPESERRLSVNGTDATNENMSPNTMRRKPRTQKDADQLVKIFPGARSILFVPLWDSDRNRWFAGTLVWTNDPEHVFTFENELVYITAFANSIMAEVRRLDVEMADRAKTNLVSSITHELRNPLHGILGTSDILSDTAMNALQHGMVHTIESCGRTLLDTINNLLDLTFIDKYQTKRARKNANLGDRQSDLPSNPDADEKELQGKEEVGGQSSMLNVKLDVILEEVTECVFAGYSFYHHPEAPPPALNESSSQLAGLSTDDIQDKVDSNASRITIIFDIQSDTEWDFYTHAGAWRRILMNVFGNALKYTDSGYIYVGLKSSKVASKPNGRRLQEGDEFEVTLTVEDTGKGIGAEYLQNDIFTPFKQENSLAPGSGLGLSIVRQAVGFLGGSIEIESTVGVGTKLTIKTPLVRSPSCSHDSSSSAMMFGAQQKYTEGKTIGFLGFGSSLTSQRDTVFYSSLERLCRDWFKLNVVNTSSLDSQAGANNFDFYLAVQTELDAEDLVGRNLFDFNPSLPPNKSSATTTTTTAPVVVICQSPEEAHRMFVEAKNQGDMPLFEFISQPCGPRKLARALNMCIKRQSNQLSGKPEIDEPTRWVEMPESSHLPLDINPSDEPRNRMRIGKRPTAETMGNGSPERRKRTQEEEEEEVKEESPNDVNPRNGAALQPLTADASLLGQEGQTTQERRRAGSVLLVDDNDVNLQLLCAYTQKEKYSYMTATNGAEAVARYRDHPGLFRVVIIDISMPVMDGFEASRQIRRLEKEHRAKMMMTQSAEQRTVPPTTIIAALTGLHSSSAQKEAFGSGIDTFLVKPVKRADLQAILRRAHER